MKFGNIQIGGKNVEPASVRIILVPPDDNKEYDKKGTKDATMEGIKYLSIGKNILGNLKRQMVLGYIKSGQTEKKINQDVKIKATSNMYGLADIDMIFIYVKVKATATATTGEYIIGYIANLIADIGSDPNTRYGYQTSILSANKKDYLETSNYMIATARFSQGFYNYDLPYTMPGKIAGTKDRLSDDPDYSWTNDGNMIEFLVGTNTVVQERTYTDTGLQPPVAITVPAGSLPGLNSWSYRSVPDGTYDALGYGPINGGQITSDIYNGGYSEDNIWKTDPTPGGLWCYGYIEAVIGGMDWEAYHQERFNYNMNLAIPGAVSASSAANTAHYNSQKDAIYANAYKFSTDSYLSPTRSYRNDNLNIAMDSIKLGDDDVRKLALNINDMAGLITYMPGELEYSYKEPEKTEWIERVESHSERLDYDHIYYAVGTAYVLDLGDFSCLHDFTPPYEDMGWAYDRTLCDTPPTDVITKSTVDSTYKINDFVATGTVNPGEYCVQFFDTAVHYYGASRPSYWKDELVMLIVSNKRTFKITYDVHSWSTGDELSITVGTAFNDLVEVVKLQERSFSI